MSWENICSWNCSMMQKRVQNWWLVKITLLYTLSVAVYSCIQLYLWREGCLINLSLKNSLPMFRLNAPVIIGAKVKKCEQTLPFIAAHYWGYTSFEVKGRWGLLLPPCLLITVVQQPVTSSPPSLDVQGLLHQQLQMAALVHTSSLSPWWQLEHSVETSASYFSSSNW